MKHLLGIETATDVCSVAVAIEGTVRCAIGLDRPRRHAEQLVPMIDEALRTAGLEPARIDAVAVSAGPGSYTGLRIGVSTAKGIAVATGARLIPVPSLTAVASAASAPVGTRVIAVFPSRRDEIYAASVSIEAPGQPIAGAAPFAGSPEDAARDLNIDPSCLIVGPGADRLVGALRRVGQTAPWDPGVLPHAAAIIDVALSMPEASPPVDVDRFEPYYLREFTARPAAGSVFDRLSF